MGVEHALKFAVKTIAHRVGSYEGNRTRGWVRENTIAHRVGS